MKKILFTAIALMVSLSTIVSATTYYVSTTGSDTNTGTEALPWKTIQKAANTMVAGDTVKIQPGTYSESVWPKNSGTADKPITYKKEGASPVVIISQNWAGVVINQKDWTVFDGLTINGNGGSHAVVMRNANHNTIMNCDVSNAEILIHAYAGSPEYPEYGVTSIGNIFLNNTVHDSVHTPYGEGIYIKQYMPISVKVSYVQDTIIENNTIYNVVEAIQTTAPTWVTDTQLDYFYPGSILQLGTIVRGNRIHNNLCEQGVICGGGKNYLIENNLVYNNMGTGTLCGIAIGGDNLTIRNNIIVYTGGASSYRDAIYLTETTGEISHNTIAYSDNRGITLNYNQEPLSSLSIKNNIIYAIANRQIGRNGNTSKLVLDYNLFGKNETDLGTHYIIGDPKFITTTNPQDNDFFHLQSDSPACNGGEGGTYLGAFPCNSIQPPTCSAADINCDTKVDVIDLSIVANDFGKTTNLNNAKSDTNNDGIVDIYDVVYVASRII